MDRLTFGDSIAEGHEHLAAFNTPVRMYELLVMFFGLKNSPAAFQRMMNKEFRDMMDEGWLIIYMDNMLILSKSKEELEERMKQVLQWLKERDLYLKLKKCKFCQTHIDYL